MANVPTKKFRAGQVNVAVWRNSGKGGDYYTVSVVRTYKEDDAWKESTSFFPADAPVVAELMRFAFHWMTSNPLESENGKGKRR